MYKQLSTTPKTIKIQQYGVYVIILGVPFYAFLSTWLGTSFGSVLFFRAWKEVLLAGLALLAAIHIAKNVRLRRVIFQDKILQLIGVFAVWVLFMTVLQMKDLDAAVLGVAIQLRTFTFFITALMVSLYIKVPETTLIKLITVPAIGVIAFGLLQLFLLPHDFLKHFGYEKSATIPPYFTIDEQHDTIRIASTLRGPNPLGVYLIMPIFMVAQKIKELFTQNALKKAASISVCLVASGIVLYGSHSRSAWLGLIASAAVYASLSLSLKLKGVFVALFGIALVLGGIAAYQYRHTSFVQDVILHDDPSEGGEISSNQGHLEALRIGLSDIQKRPLFGCGAGCAGPASVHNQNGARIAENFYLQTGQELGLVGLALLVCIHALIVKRLLHQVGQFNRLWVAVFVGISVASLLSHAWADDTVSYLWWGIAGLIFGGQSKQFHSVRRE